MRWLLISLLAACLPACTRSESADVKTPAPATLSNPQTEADLATTKLTPEAIERLGIESVVAEVENLAGTRTVGGEIAVPEGRSVVVAAPVAGTLVAASEARAGARVERGEAIFRLVPLVPAERDQRIEAERALSAAEAEELAARQRLERLQQLLGEGAASAKSVEEAKAQHGVASAALAAARERLSVVRLNPIGPQGEISITTPFGGVLQSISAAPGQTVAASAPLFEIAQVAALWVRVPLYAGDVATLDPEKPAAVTTLDSSGPPLLARRVQAPLRGDPAGASVDLFFELPAGGKPLRPGERVSVQLPLTAREKGLTIPYSAVVYDIHGATWVYEDLGDGVYARRRVEVARHAGDKVEVARGLSPGVRVVSVGAAELFGTEFGAGK
jgi:RND family efflux transporter MFP subunit